MSSTVYALHRVEPISREGDPGRGLAAPVHDPLWALGRQRAFGELAGEDCGSPIQVSYRVRTDPIDGWSPLDAAEAPLPFDAGSEVLDAVVAGESAAPAHTARDRLDAGRRLTRLAPDLAAACRATHPIEVPRGDVVAGDVVAGDAAAAGAPADRLLRRAAAVHPDGLAVAAAVWAGGSDAELAAALGVVPPLVTTHRATLDAFAAWVLTTFGLTPNTWVPERLERRFGLSVAGVAALAAPVHTRDAVDATDLELTAASAALPMPGPDDPVVRRIPTPIRFPGMPNDRYWEFEDARLALHRIDASTHDLSRLALVEYSTVYGNDWFTFPVPLPHGVVATMTEVVIRDVFGTDELITAADDPAWAMYACTRPPGVPQRLVLAPVSVGTMTGGVVEEVAFVRDENANLVWGLEKVVTDAVGRARDLVAEYAAHQAPPAALPTDAELLYRLSTEVPEHWVPFIPVRLDAPGGGDAANRAVGLVEAVLPRPNSWGRLVTVAPRSTVLAELQGTVLREEEVPSEGVTVRRRWYLTRSPDGARHTWAAREVGTGRGEGASGLAFDITLDLRGEGHA